MTFASVLFNSAIWWERAAHAHETFSSTKKTKTGLSSTEATLSSFSLLRLVTYGFFIFPPGPIVIYPPDIRKCPNVKQSFSTV